MNILWKLLLLLQQKQKQKKHHAGYSLSKIYATTLVDYKASQRGGDWARDKDNVVICTTKLPWQILKTKLPLAALKFWMDGELNPPLIRYSLKNFEIHISFAEFIIFI